MLQLQSSVHTSDMRILCSWANAKKVINGKLKYELEKSHWEEWRELYVRILVIEIRIYGNARSKNKTNKTNSVNE